MLYDPVFHTEHDGALSDVIGAKKVSEKCIMLLSPFKYFSKYVG